MADKKPDEEKGGFLSGAASVAKWGVKAFIWDTDDSLGANLVKVGLTVGSVALIPFSAGGSLAARGAITAGAVASKVPAVANVLSKTGLVAARTVAKEGAELAAKTVIKEGAEVAAKTAAKTAAREGAEAAAKTGAKVAQEAVEAGVKKVRLTGANEEALSAMKAAKEAGEAARAGGQAATQATTTAAKTATTAATEKAGVEAVQVAAEAGSKLGFFKARHILKSDSLSLAEKLTQLSKGGRGDYCEKLLMQARKEGLKATDIDLIRKADGIPAALKTKFETLHTPQSAGGVAAKVDKATAIALDAAKHPLRTGKDLLTAQVTVPVAALKLANQHRIVTAGVVAGGAALHGATGGASTEFVGDAAHAVGSAYWSVDKFLAGSALNIGAAGMNAISPASAEAFVQSSAQIAEDVAKQTPSFLLSLGAHAAGTTPEEITKNPVKFAEEHPLLNFILPAPVRHAVTGAKIAEKAQNNKGENGSADGSAPAPEGSTMTNVPGQTLAERAQGAVDKARGIKDEAEEKLLGDLDISSMMADPKAAWDKVKLAAEKNPQLKKLVEIGEQHPYMKYGIMAGMAYGALTNEGNRLGGAIKGAMIFGILGDLIGALFGQKSFILEKIKEIRNSNSAVPGFETPRPSAYATPSSRQQSRGVDGPGIVSDAKPKEDFGKRTAVQPAPVVVAQAPSSESAAPGADRRRRFEDYEMQRSPMGSNTPALTPVPSLGG